MRDACFLRPKILLPRRTLLGAVVDVHRRWGFPLVFTMQALVAFAGGTITLLCSCSSHVAAGKMAKRNMLHMQFIPSSDGWYPQQQGS